MFDRHRIERDLEQYLPRALDLLHRMVDINSFTTNRTGVDQLGQHTAQAFASLGFTAEFVPSVNPTFGKHLVLTRPGRGPHAIAFVSHLDTVFPPEEEERNDFHWRPEGDRIYGPGTDDIKGGTALLWLMLTSLRNAAPALFEYIAWSLFFNSSEERLSADFGDVCRRRFLPGTLAALVLEGENFVAGQRRLVVARKGRATWRATVLGRGAHAGNRHHEGANAIVQLGRTLQQIAALSRPDVHLTFNPGTITGGTVTNRVPHEASAEGELRAFSPQIFADAKAALLALNGPGEIRSASDGFACQVRIEILDESRPWPRNPGTERLLQIWQRTGTELGLPVGFEERGGLSDANLIWDAVPSLDGLGPYGDNAHCSEQSPDGSKCQEYVAVSSFVPKALLNLSAIHHLVTSA